MIYLKIIISYFLYQTTLNSTASILGLIFPFLNYLIVLERSFLKVAIVLSKRMPSVYGPNYSLPTSYLIFNETNVGFVQLKYELGNIEKQNKEK